MSDNAAPARLALTSADLEPGSEFYVDRRELLVVVSAPARLRDAGQPPEMKVRVICRKAFMLTLEVCDTDEAVVFDVDFALACKWGWKYAEAKIPTADEIPENPVLCLVAGASAPSFREHTRIERRPAEIRSEGTAYFRYAGDHHDFAVTPCVLVGTVDEITEYVREQLQTVVKLLYEMPTPTPLIASQEALKATPGYTPGKAVMIPFADANQPQGD